MTGALRGSGRTAALRLAADTAQVLGDVANGVVEPSRLRDLTLRLVQGGGIQKKFAELMLPELQDDHDPPLDIDNVTEEIVRILSVIKTTHFDNLPLGRSRTADGRRRVSHVPAPLRPALLPVRGVGRARHKVPPPPGRLALPSPPHRHPLHARASGLAAAACRGPPTTG